jgi:hypothetical protein
MKKIFFSLIALVGIVSISQAQVPLKTVHTITAADTITLSLVSSKVVSLACSYVETSGTSAGKFYIQGTVDGVTWKHIDSSFSLADVTTAQGVIVTQTATSYLSYRGICSNTSGATGTFTFTALRRPDDR